MGGFFASSRLSGAAAAAVAIVLAGPVTAQTNITEFRKLLAESAELSNEEFSSLESGKPVVKALSVVDKQEVAVIGVILIDPLPSITLEAFRDSMSQKNSPELNAQGRFSSPPSMLDLSGFELEDRDFKELQKCTLGNCDMNMSAEWIKRFNSEIDWSKPGNKEKATQLFRQMLLQYVQDYSSSGTASLGEYSNRNKTVDLQDAHLSLNQSTLFLKEIGPELFEYLRDFPRGELNGEKSEFHWSILDFGLNPTVTLTHASAFTNAAGQHFLVTRQFYSSRYLDASLTLAMLLRFDSGTYLVFTDRSRSDALGGIFHGLSKGIVETEAIERVRNVIQRATQRLELKNKTASAEETQEKTSQPAVRQGLTTLQSWLIVLGIVTGSAILILAVRHIRRR